jgi:hypothetical protein
MLYYKGKEFPLNLTIKQMTNQEIQAALKLRQIKLPITQIKAVVSKLTVELTSENIDDHLDAFKGSSLVPSNSTPKNLSKSPELPTVVTNNQHIESEQRASNDLVERFKESVENTAENIMQLRRSYPKAVELAVLQKSMDEQDVFAANTEAAYTAIGDYWGF